MRYFYEKHGVKLDPIYTGKLVMSLYDMAQSGQLHERLRHNSGQQSVGGRELCRVLAVHTGGLQGIAGAEQRLGEKIFPD